MKAIVVYESIWGNTAAIAKSIAAGIGPDARAFSTSEATEQVLADADFIVAGAPVLAFSLPTEQMRENIRSGPNKAPVPADFSNPSLRSWMAKLPSGKRGRSAAFETRIWWSPGGSTRAIQRTLSTAGYEPVAKAQKFIVKGTYGPLKEGEIERARAWGTELARLMK